MRHKIHGLAGKTPALFLLALLMLVIAGCEEDPENQPPPPPAAFISLSPSTIALKRGETRTASATLMLNNVAAVGENWSIAEGKGTANLQAMDISPTSNTSTATITLAMDNSTPNNRGEGATSWLLDKWLNVTAWLPPEKDGSQKQAGGKLTLRISMPDLQIGDATTEWGPLRYRLYETFTASVTNDPSPDPYDFQAVCTSRGWGTSNGPIHDMPAPSFSYSAQDGRKVTITLTQAVTSDFSIVTMHNGFYCHWGISVIATSKNATLRAGRRLSASGW